MRGHIVKRYKDSYTVVLNLGRDPITCKRKQQWVTVKGTKKDAEKKLAELLHQLDTGTLIIPGKITLGEAAELSGVSFRRMLDILAEHGVKGNVRMNQQIKALDYAKNL